MKKGEEMSLKIIGKTLERIDGKSKTYGKAKYAADYYFDRMLYAGVVYSNVTHAKLLKIDTSEAEKVDGIVKIATYKDIPGENQLGQVINDMPFLIPENGKIRFEHDSIALIAAENEESIENAMKKVKFSYEELPGIYALEDALKEEVIINGNSNIAFHKKIRNGNVEKGFENSELIIEREFYAGYQEQAYIEPQSIIAIYDNDFMTIYGSMQCPFYVQKDVSRVLGIPFNKVNVIQAETGGAFGGKEDVPSYIAAKAALLSYLTKRPVKLIYKREHDIKETSKRHPIKSKYKVGFSKDGKIEAMKIESYMDMGAYATLSPIVGYRTLTHAAGAYEVGNVNVDVFGVYTNKVPCGAFRGFGSPQVLFAIESVMDEAAKLLDMDPWEIRYKNALEVGSSICTGQVLKSSVGAKKTLENVKKISDYENLKKSVEVFNRSHTYIKRGLGWSHTIYGESLGAGGQHLDASGAEVHVHRDGSVNIMIGGTEIGQGARMVMSMIASEILGQTVDKIHVLKTTTSIIQDSGPTVASRTTVFSGNAVKNACEKIKDNILNYLSDKYSVQKDKIEIGAGSYKINGQIVPFDKIATECNDNNVKITEMGWYKTSKLNFDMENGLGEAYVTYVYSTQLSLIEVDLLTGKINPIEFWISHDIGKAINYDGVIGQIQGGAVQGMGYAIYEEIKQKDGKIITDNFNNYIIPGIKDIPKINIDIVEEAFEEGPFGAKGIGEPSLMSAPPSVANAVSAAANKRMTKIPISAEDII